MSVGQPSIRGLAHRAVWEAAESSHSTGEITGVAARAARVGSPRLPRARARRLAAVGVAPAAVHIATIGMGTFDGHIQHCM